MKKAFLVILVLGIAFAAISCRTFQVSGLEASMQGNSGNVVGTFDTKVWVHKFLGTSGGRNLFNITSAATDAVVIDAVRREIMNYGGDRAVNVKIEYKASFVDMLANGITGSLWAPATVRITGTVVKNG